MPSPKYFLIVCVFLHLSVKSASQDSLPDFDQSVRMLSDKDDRVSKSFAYIVTPLLALDSVAVFEFISRLERRFRIANAYYKARLICINSFFKLRHRQFQSKMDIILLSEAALNYAYETGDDYLIAFVSFHCGTNSLEIQEMEVAATYLLKSREFYDRLDPSVEQQFAHWTILGEVLFYCREYEKSIFYTRKAIEIYTDSVERDVLTRFHNTIAQGFDKLGIWDSAFLYYEKSMKMAASDVWKGINAGYIGELYFRKKEYALAKPLLEFNYAVNKTKEYDHAAKSLQVLAAIDLAQHKNDSALIKVREALDLIKKSGSGYYLQPLFFLERIYFTASDVHRALGNTDSFYVYNHLYSNLHDSLQRVSLLISTRIAQLRIDNDNNLRGIQLLQKEKQTADLKRNFLILFFLLVTIILLLYLNSIRLRQKHRQELAMQQKNAAEAELLTARQQMKQFTENIIEKTALIEKLNLQISNREQNTEQQQLINDLAHQTILTEENWENFKSLFEKIYPGFFINLKGKARDITVSEQRMAALTKLNLTARHMASMLGISVDSVHKTRQRLRQRLHIPTEIELEESMASL